MAAVGRLNDGRFILVGDNPNATEHKGIADMKRLILAFFAAAFVVLGVTGCNTMRGAGEDIESTGEAIQRGAQ
jgi:entericidin B